MNERYLFRGKRKDNGEWAYGGLDTDWGLEPKDRDRYWIIQAYLGEALVIPETIGQCTRLRDKNGNWIFEGDILESRYDEKHPDDACCEVVLWYDNGWCIQEYEDADPDHLSEDDMLKYSEVVGNVHDNPELLEVSE